MCHLASVAITKVRKCESIKQSKTKLTIYKKQIKKLRKKARKKERRKENLDTMVLWSNSSCIRQGGQWFLSQQSPFLDKTNAKTEGHGPIGKRRPVT